MRRVLTRACDVYEIYGVKQAQEWLWTLRIPTWRCAFSLAVAKAPRTATTGGSVRATRTTRPNTGRDGLLTLLLTVTLGALMLVVLSACGAEAATGESTSALESSSVTGSYRVESSTGEGMDAFTLTLKDDGTCTLTQPDPNGGEDVAIGGTYTVEGDKIGVANDEGSESDTGTIEGDRLVFETITWVKQ